MRMSRIVNKNNVRGTDLYSLKVAKIDPPLYRLVLFFTHYFNNMMTSLRVRSGVKHDAAAEATVNGAAQASARAARLSLGGSLRPFRFFSAALQQPSMQEVKDVTVTI